MLIHVTEMPRRPEPHAQIVSFELFFLSTIFAHLIALVGINILWTFFMEQQRWFPSAACLEPTVSVPCLSITHISFLIIGLFGITCPFPWYLSVGERKLLTLSGSLGFLGSHVRQVPASCGSPIPHGGGHQEHLFLLWGCRGWAVCEQPRSFCLLSLSQQTPRHQSQSLY